MELFLNAGLGAGILIFFVLFSKKNKKKEDYFFLLWIAIVIFQIAFYQITIYHFTLKGIWAILGFALPLLSASSLFLYISALTNQIITVKKVFLHTSSFFLYVFALILFQNTQDFTFIAVNGYFSIPNNITSWSQFYAIPIAFSGLLYAFWDLLLLKQHQKTIGDFFSFDEKINLKWVQYIVYSFFLSFFLGTFLVLGAIHFSLFPMEKVFALMGILLSITLVAFGFYGLRQTNVFLTLTTITAEIPQNKSIANKTTSSYSKSGLSKENAKNLALQLEEFMSLKKPFLQENLNLSSLATESKISSSHLSQIINQHFKVNFYDFINQYRIEESKKMLLSSKYNHLSLLGIAFDCGFKSKSSFNRYFKKYCGITPSEFKKTNQ